MSSFRSNESRQFLQSLRQLMRADNALNWGDWSRLFYWRLEEIQYSFLLGTLPLWDSTDHVFRIGIDELCPTYEEFSWFLGQPLDADLATLDPTLRPRLVLAEILQVDSRVCRSMFTPAGLDLRRLVRFLLDSADDPVFTRARTVGAMTCCFATLLFVTGNFLVDPSIVLLVQQALSGRSIVPFVLAETFNGLDNMTTGTVDFFYGSPLLLYMWLLERFRFVSDRHVGPAILRNPARFFRRTILLGGSRSAYDWTTVFCEISRSIRWHVPWWRLRSMVLSTGGQYYVRIWGLHMTSYYIPSRLLRQFNVPWRHFLEPQDFSPESIPVHTRLIRRLSAMWVGRLTRTFGAAEFGISRPMAERYIRQIWDRVKDRVLGIPLQMRWCAFMEQFPTNDVIVLAYEIMDQARIEFSAEDDQLPPPLA